MFTINSRSVTVHAGRDLASALGRESAPETGRRSQRVVVHRNEQGSLTAYPGFIRSVRDSGALGDDCNDCNLSSIHVDRVQNSQDACDIAKIYVSSMLEKKPTAADLREAIPDATGSKVLKLTYEPALEAPAEAAASDTDPSWMSW